MANHRSQNFLSQQRLEASNLKSIESAVSFDFDALVGLGLTRGTPVVLKGLVLNSTGVINQPATNLTVVMAGSVIWNYSASEAGTAFTISSSEPDQRLSTTNNNVVGSFLNGTNYVGVDFYKTPDSNTADTVKFIDSDQRKEYSQVVPLARTLKYKIYISTQPFSATLNVTPIAKVVVSNGSVVSVTDARPMLFRLGSGGDAPSATNSYLWGSRTENAVTISSNASGSPFNGEDKSINNLKDWIDSTMTSLWELRGGTAWYSNVYRDHVKLTYGPDVMENGDNIWNLHGVDFVAGSVSKAGTSIVTVNFVNHPFTVGSRFDIVYNPGDVDFEDGVFTVLSTPTADSFTYDDGGAATVSTTAADATLQNTVAFSGLSLLFENSGSDSIYKDTIADGTVVMDDKYCAFVDLDRSVNATLNVQVRPLYDLSTPALPGRRHIIAWRDGDYIYGKDKNYEAGRTFIAATTSALGLVKLNQIAGAPSAPVVVSIMANGRIQVAATGGNANAATFTGNGSGAGVLATGGSSAGAAGVTGASGNGLGSAGVFGSGGSALGGYGVLGSAGSGVSAQGVAGLASNVSGIAVAGTATGSALYGVAGNGPIGVYGVGSSGGTAGVKGEGAGASVVGGQFTGGSNAAGVTGTGTGTGAGGDFTGGVSGNGVTAETASNGDYGGYFENSGGGTGVFGYSSAAGGVGVLAEGDSGVSAFGNDYAVELTGGDLRLLDESSTPITYVTPPTYTAFGSIQDSSYTTHWVKGSGYAGFNDGYPLSTGSTAADPTTLIYRIRVPKKAIIQSVKAYAYAGAAVTLQTNVFFMTSGATRAVSYLNPGLAAGDTTAATGVSTETLITIPITGTPAIADNQDLYVGVGRNGTNNTLQIGGILVEYTLPTLTGAFS